MKHYEVFLQTIRADLKCPADLIVSVIHWVLVNDFGYKCIGIGEECKPEDEKKSGSDLLPSGWNGTPNAYNLLYRLNEKSDVLLLKCIVVSNMLVATALPLKSHSSQKVHSISIPLPESATLSEETIKKFLNEESEELSKTIHKKMFSQFGTPKKETATLPPHGVYGFPDDISPMPSSYPVPPPIRPNIGGADLDPFGTGAFGGGGGMMFDPFAGNRLRFPGGRPGVPPAARYDPFSPFPNHRFSRPDPDHFPPPGGPGFGFL